MTTKAEPWQIVLMLFNIDVIFTHFILLFSRFNVTVAYGLIKFCKKKGGAPDGAGWGRLPAAGCVEGLCSLTLKGKVAAYGHACGVRVQKVLRVLRFDSGLWPLRVVVSPPLAAIIYMPPVGGNAAGGSENRTTGPAARWKCTPSVACGDVSPGGGGLLSAELLYS